MTRSAGVSPAGRDASRVPIVLFVAFFAFGTSMCLLTIVLLAFPGTALDALWRANHLRTRSGFGLCAAFWGFGLLATVLPL